MSHYGEVVMEKSPRAIGNILVMVMFASLGLVDVISRRYVEAILWLSLAAALGSFGSESTPWAKIPGWRRAAGMIVLAVGVALFAFQVGKDFAS